MTHQDFNSRTTTANSPRRSSPPTSPRRGETHSYPAANAVVEAEHKKPTRAKQRPSVGLLPGGRQTEEPRRVGNGWDRGTRHSRGRAPESVTGVERHATSSIETLDPTHLREGTEKKAGAELSRVPRGFWRIAWRVHEPILWPCGTLDLEGDYICKDEWPSREVAEQKAAERHAAMIAHDPDLQNMIEPLGPAFFSEESEGP